MAHTKVYWLSRHELSPAQRRAIADIHGEDAEVVQEPVSFANERGLLEFCQSHNGSWVYAVASGVHYLRAALAGCRFGIFENWPAKRADGQFGLASVYHVDGGHMMKVWQNPDPNSDNGEPLVPVAPR